MDQKFKRGNLVKILIGRQGWTSNGDGWEIQDSRPQDIGKLAVIEYSYAEKYGGSKTNDYSIIFMDNGRSMAWKHEHELELVDIGGEHLIQQAKAKGDEIKKRNTNLKYIKDHWNEIVERTSSDTILYLFDKLGIQTSFYRNGEYFILFNTWYQALPLYDLIFRQESKENVLSVLTEQASKEFRDNVSNFYDEVANA
jgi:hypothetical protein